VFSGIVEELGRVSRNAVAAEGRLEISAGEVLADAHVGDSIAVNGCCLTVVGLSTAGFSADVMPETASRTNLGELSAGDVVNLEGALRYGERVGGHIVTGHIDAVGRVTSLRPDGNATWVWVAAPRSVLELSVEKGCVAVDGISLTIVDVADDGFSVSLIPHTVASTTASTWTVGSLVNLEADLVAKHVARGLAAHVPSLSPPRLRVASPQEQ
jgi:riboflavin synthase